VPGRVITGTPLQSVSEAAVPPLDGLASSARSTVLNERGYPGSAKRGKIASRSAAIPARSKSRVNPARTGPFGMPAKTNRESGNRVKISAQRRRVDWESFKALLNDPNVTNPLRTDGGASAQSIETIWR